MARDYFIIETEAHPIPPEAIEEISYFPEYQRALRSFISSCTIPFVGPNAAMEGIEADSCFAGNDSC